jgi:hypothetical protein
VLLKALRARKVYKSVREHVDGYGSYAQGVHDFGITANRIRYAGSRAKSLAKNGLSYHEAHMIWEVAKDVGVRKASRVAQKTWRSYATKKVEED